MSWNARMVIQMAGIQIEHADEFIIALAEKCVDRCYYLDRAAEELARMLGGKRWR